MARAKAYSNLIPQDDLLIENYFIPIHSKKLKDFIEKTRKAYVLRHNVPKPSKSDFAMLLFKEYHDIWVELRRERNNYTEATGKEISTKDLLNMMLKRWREDGKPAG